MYVRMWKLCNVSDKMSFIIQMKWKETFYLLFDSSKSIEIWDLWQRFVASILKWRMHFLLSDVSDMSLLYYYTIIL